jgi:hypothetical protein
MPDQPVYCENCRWILPEEHIPYFSKCGHPNAEYEERQTEFIMAPRPGLKPKKRQFCSVKNHDGHCADFEAKK